MQRSLPPSLTCCDAVVREKFEKDGNYPRTGIPPATVRDDGMVTRAGVEGCGKDLTYEKAYFQRYRVCQQHLALPSLLVDGRPSRFCQQCARFHDVTEFDASKRSCRARLQQHNARRRKREHAAQPMLSVVADILPAAVAADWRMSGVPPAAKGLSAATVAPSGRADKRNAGGVITEVLGGFSDQQWPPLAALLGQSPSVPGLVGGMPAPAMSGLLQPPPWQCQPLSAAPGASTLHWQQQQLEQQQLQQHLQAQQLQLQQQTLQRRTLHQQQQQLIQQSQSSPEVSATQGCMDVDADDLHWMAMLLHGPPGDGGQGTVEAAGLQPPPAEPAVGTFAAGGVAAAAPAAPQHAALPLPYSLDYFSSCGADSLQAAPAATRFSDLLGPCTGPVSAGRAYATAASAGGALPFATPPGAAPFTCSLLSGHDAALAPYPQPPVCSRDLSLGPCPPALPDFNSMSSFDVARLLIAGGPEAVPSYGAACTAAYGAGFGPYSTAGMVAHGAQAAPACGPASKPAFGGTGTEAVPAHGTGRGPAFGVGGVPAFGAAGAPLYGPGI